MTTEKRHEYIEHPLPPLFNPESRILILGSFPSVKTREANFFYGHPQNRFWPMLSKVLNIDPPLSASEPERTRRLVLGHRIAMWDSIASCEIVGSSDSSIKNVVPNDFSQIFAAAQIRHIFCNGGAAYDFFRKHQKEYVSIGVSKMPSTSPANAAWSLERLAQAWSAMLPYLRED